MSDEADKDAAWEELVRRCQPESEPKLTLAEMLEILNRHQRAQRWTASTSLTLGTVIMPTIRNGHVYRVIVEGITAATELTWPTGEADTVVDGTATLLEAGADFANVYDIRGMIEDAWTLKAAKSTEFHEGEESKIHAQCRDMARSYSMPLIG